MPIRVKGEKDGGIVLIRNWFKYLSTLTPRNLLYNIVYYLETKKKTGQKLKVGVWVRVFDDLIKVQRPVMPDLGAPADQLTLFQPGRADYP